MGTWQGYVHIHREPQNIKEAKHSGAKYDQTILDVLSDSDLKNWCPSTDAQTYDAVLIT